MTTPFVAQIRARADALVLTGGTGVAITVRVEMPETWDTVKAIVSPDTPALSLKLAALDALFPSAEGHEAFVLKFRGWEVLDENASLLDVGAVNGSIFLLTHRRRQPVR
ncbi:MAG: hypothetical protein M3Z05_09385 [Gemmatimonadota bacterium]|nr:hypothetical protein [Gemmatimonadota bacterium]